MTTMFNIARYMLYLVIGYCIWQIGLHSLSINTIELYENNVFKKSIKTSDIFDTRVSVYNFNSSKIYELLVDMNFVSKIENSIFNNGMAKINLRTHQPRYVIEHNGKSILFNNIWKEVKVTNKKEGDAYKGIKALRITVPNLDFINKRYLKSHVSTHVSEIEKYCNFDSIVRVAFLKNIYRINITFQKLPKVAILSKNIKYSCGMISEFYDKFKDDLYKVQYLDLRLPKNAVFRILK